eukprot:TRINITY_DN70913_c0_g1_i1.p1 TRINITY_DN70913_c0_g1~~TRINITY_DN70913_c0_g1_i1.p1  ORF type:complete len:273 (-),score=41.01 TRINITY_DN70913_c0_g1_i1:148-870(-)
MAGCWSSPSAPLRTSFGYLFLTTIGSLLQGHATFIDGGVEDSYAPISARVKRGDAKNLANELGLEPDAIRNEVIRNDEIITEVDEDLQYEEKLSKVRYPSAIDLEEGQDESMSDVVNAMADRIDTIAGRLTKDCWWHCKGGGTCMSFCGAGKICCRWGYSDDPYECGQVSRRHFRHTRTHLCVPAPASDYHGEKSASLLAVNSTSADEIDGTTATSSVILGADNSASAAGDSGNDSVAEA